MTKLLFQLLVSFHFCFRYDEEHTQDEQVHLDCFCVIAQAIERNANGQKLKDLIVEHGIVKQCLSYIQQHAPPIKTLLAYVFINLFL